MPLNNDIKKAQEEVNQLSHNAPLEVLDKIQALRDLINKNLPGLAQKKLEEIKQFHYTTSWMHPVQQALTLMAEIEEFIRYQHIIQNLVTYIEKEEFDFLRLLDEKDKEKALQEWVRIVRAQDQQIEAERQQTEASLLQLVAQNPMLLVPIIENCPPAYQTVVQDTNDIIEDIFQIFDPEKAVSKDETFLCLSIRSKFEAYLFTPDIDKAIDAINQVINALKIYRNMHYDEYASGQGTKYAQLESLRDSLIQKKQEELGETHAQAFRPKPPV